MQSMHSLKQHIHDLSEVGRAAVNDGLALASGGNLSIRVDDDQYLITGSGTWLNQLESSSFSVINGRGEVLAGHPKPSSEWRLHTRAYEARNDAQSVIHLHPQVSVMVDAIGATIQLVTMDHANYVKKVERIDFYHNGTDQLADEAAKKAQDANCVILAHHGCMCLGDTIQMAFRRVLNLEQAAEMTYRLMTLQRPDVTFPPHELSRLSHH